VIGTSPLAGGVATFTLSSLAVGAIPSPRSTAATARTTAARRRPLAQTVNSVATANDAHVECQSIEKRREVVFTATVSPSAATGTVQFLDGSTVLGTATLGGGSASFATSALGGGST